MSRWLAAIDRAFPRFAFARHIPPAAIARRLSARSGAAIRRVLDRPPALDRTGLATGLRPPGTLPVPVLPLRPAAVSCDADGWRFTLLNRSVPMSRRIDWTAPSMSPDDQLWRMTLHYMEYLESLPVTDAAAAISQWITANPMTRAGADSDGWNSYALSIRIVCWLQWLARHDDRAEAVAMRPAMEQSLRQHIAYLLCHLERDIGGNHLIKNIKALLWAGKALQGAGAEKCTALGWRLLQGELDQQVLPDGVHYERSPAYHAQVTADLIDIYSVLDVDRRQQVEPVLGRMLAAARALSHADGLAAQFNDCGLNMAYRPDDLATSARRLGLHAPAGRRTATFPVAGFLAWHDGDDSCIAKLGQIAPDTLPAHGHGDIGSFELSVSGRRCIVDQGVYSYVPGDRRTASRATASHNVTQVGDWDHAAFFGAFRMGWRARPWSEMTVDGAGQAQAIVRHDAFARPGGCGLLTRSLAVSPGTLTVRDGIEQSTTQPLCTRLLIHPDWQVTVNDSTAVLRCEGRILRLSASFPMVSETAEWWPDMGKSLATVRLVMLWPHGATAMTQDFNWHDSTS